MFGVRLISVTGPLGDALAFSQMQGEEALGRPFQYQLEVLAEDHALDLSQLLGQTLTVQVELQNGGLRFFNGHVTRLTMAGTVGRYARYQATLRPWLWLLTRTSNCRIFQNQSIPDIVKQIFRENGFSNFKESLSGEYRPWEYLVQYRESDFNFVSRLLEQEGIYFYFTHEPGKHTLVLADSYAAHKDDGFELVPYFPPSDRAQHDDDHIDTWSASLAIQSGAYVATDYDFERPAANLFAKLALPGKFAQGDRELYDYPGQYLTADDGQRQVRVRLEEQQAEQDVCQGAGNVRALRTGGLVRMTGYPREDQNKEYLIVSTTYDLAGNPVETQTGEGARYRSAFTCVDSQRPYRTPRTTRRPTVEGPQTATVVGKEGEEIFTDKYGRVKVRFHWDREGNPQAAPDPHLQPPRDPARPEEDSSCWVRVAQVWAGANWGAMHIPRVGHEVIVDFLEGDPDRPIITGRVYNGKNLPPYDLPANQTQSGIKSRSSKGGGPDNFNEIRFEDKKGAEELHIQAEKDQTTLVKNDQSVTVQHDQSVTVQNDRALTVQGNETIDVAKVRATTVHQAENQTFQLRTMTVLTTDTVTVTGARTETFQGGRSATVQSGDSLTVNGSDKTTTVHGQYNITADAQFQAQQGPNKLTIKDSVHVDSVGQIRLDNKSAWVDLDNGVLTIHAGTQIRLECGRASIVLSSDGTVAIDGPTSAAITSGKSSGLTVEPTKAHVSSHEAKVSGVSKTEILGGVVKVN